MRMKRAVGFSAVVVSLVTLASVAGAQPAAKTAITGTAPFTLGMATADALAADSTLTAIADARCGAPAHGASYGTRVTAPIDGYPYVAGLVLCFADDKLGAILLTWPQGTFQEETVRWQLATRALASQLAAAYAGGLVRRYTIDEDMGGVLEMADAQGNRLTMASDPGDDPGIRMTYMSAAYVQAINGKHVTVTAY
jgi:hypothetical protein